ncbi:Gfo/Idh/MocA family oxidoreductase [Halobacillus fulvus]|nr:Gfo/Idh/MocA family oxidoreductase [Halobacillus fulvus]
MIRVALLSKWHVHAVDYEKEAKENPFIEIHSVWDEDAERGQKWAEELEVPFEPDYERLLSNPDIDGVIVSTPTDLHTELILAAARNGKHVFTEKVLAFTVEECEEILEAVRQNGVEFMISLPRLTKNYYVYAQQVLDEKLLGTLTMFRCRVAHNGSVPTKENPEGWLPERFYNREQAGGGALIDLGAHPIYLANRLVGEPTAVTARLESMRNLGVDDHAAVLLEYDSGALAMLETSFLSYGSPFQLELYGTEGTLMIEGDSVRLKSSHLDQDGWVTPSELPDDLPMPMEQWAESILNGAATSISHKDAKLLTLVNQAAAVSHKEEQRVQVKDIKS